MFTAIGIVTTIILARVAMRALRYRFHERGGCGGGFRGFRGARFRHGFRRGVVDLGDIGIDSYEAGWRPNAHGRATAHDRVGEILTALELNARQAAEAGDVVALLRGAIGPARYDSTQTVLALRAVSRVPFDADLATAAIGPRVAPEAAREAVDALEHLHNILTDEQRLMLDKLTARG